MRTEDRILQILDKPGSCVTWEELWFWYGLKKEDSRRALGVLLASNQVECVGKVYTRRDANCKPT